MSSCALGSVVSVGEVVFGEMVWEGFGSDIREVPSLGFVAGHVGFSLPGGGGVNRSPQNWGGGVREKGSIDGHHYSVIMKSGAKGAKFSF